jgi:hypothetical protein
MTLARRKQQEWPGITHTARVQIFPALKIILSFIFHGAMPTPIVHEQTADCRPKPNGRKLPAGMILLEKNMLILGGIILFRRL